MTNRDLAEIFEELKQKLDAEKEYSSKIAKELDEHKNEIEKINIEKRNTFEQLNVYKTKLEASGKLVEKKYKEVIKELFAEPSKDSKRHAFWITLISVLVSVTFSWVTSFYFNNMNNIFLNDKFKKINESVSIIDEETHKLQTIIAKIDDRLDSVNNFVSTSSDELKSIKQTLSSEMKKQKKEITFLLNSRNEMEVLLNSSLQNYKSISASNKQKEVKDNEIITQTKLIVDFLMEQNYLRGFIDDYRTDKDVLALAMIFSMIRFEENMYFESFIEAFKVLEVNQEILPKSKHEIAIFFSNYYNALKSSLIVSIIKESNGFKFESKDDRLRSYSNDVRFHKDSFICFDERADYRALGRWSFMSLCKVIEFCDFNGFELNYDLPDEITYKFKSDLNSIFPFISFGKTKDSLVEISDLPINFGSDLIRDAQQKLFWDESKKKIYSNIDGVIGPKTRDVIKKYQEDNGLRVDGFLTLNTLKSLGLKPTVFSLNLDILD